MEDKNRELNPEELEQAAGGKGKWHNVDNKQAKENTEKASVDGADELAEAVESLKTLKDRASGIVTEQPMINRFKEWW